MGRAELVMVREALEGVVSPTVATTLLFEALERSGGAPPTTLEAMHAFALGPLELAVRRRLREQDASEIRERIEQLFARSGRSGDAAVLDVDVDVDLDGDEGPTDGTATAQMTVVRRPVPVVVLSAREEFASRLVLCLGEDRVKTVAVADVASLSKAVFAYSALVVVLDGQSPAEVDREALVAGLRRLPNGATTIVWASDAEGGARLSEMLDAGGAAMVTLGRADGIEPLLDLILSRRVD